VSYKFSNHTNRTVEFPLPGGGWCRLLPGQYRELDDTAAESAHVARLSRRAGIQLSKRSGTAAQKKSAFAKSVEKEVKKAPGEEVAGEGAKKTGKVETRRGAKEDDGGKNVKKTSTAKKEG